MEHEMKIAENPKERQYYGTRELKAIVLTEGVTEIGAYAFGECRGLTEAVFPESLHCIGGHAFYNCRGLHTVHFLGKVPVIEDGAFKNCEGVRLVELAGVEENDVWLKNFLPELPQELDVRLNFTSGEEARLRLPRTSYAFVANEPARMFTEESYGSGIYYRQCVGRSEVDWKRYDELFLVALREEQLPTVLAIARQRTEFPYRLAKEAEQRYLDYFKENMAKILEEAAQTEDWSLLAFLCEKKLITREMTEYGVETANRKERPYMASFLLEYGRKTFAAARERLTL